MGKQAISAAMHIDSPLTTNPGFAILGSGNGPEHAEPAPTFAAASSTGRMFLCNTERDWTELLREIAAVAEGGGRITVSVTVEPNKIRRTPQPVRIVTDPQAPKLQPQDVDLLYPWRQKELVRELNRRIGRRMLNSYDIQAVRRHHRLDERPDFVFHLPGAGRRYSPAVADWIMDEFARDAEFFHKARAADHELLRLRRERPK
jgi:hypothetical protein